MKYAHFFATLLFTSVLVGCGTQPDPDTNSDQPIQPFTNTCCGTAPGTAGFTGGNKPNDANTLGVSAADIAVLVPKTGIDASDPDKWHLFTTIVNDNGNNCTTDGDTRAIITLPPDCMVEQVSVSGPNNEEGSWTQCAAYIEVRLPQLCPANGTPGPGAHISVILKRSTFRSAACRPAFGIYAFSGMPDNVPNNNYWWWRDNCDTTSTSYDLQGAEWAPQVQPQPSKLGN